MPSSVSQARLQARPQLPEHPFSYLLLVGPRPLPQRPSDSPTRRPVASNTAVSKAVASNVAAPNVAASNTAALNAAGHNAANIKDSRATNTAGGSQFGALAREESTKNYLARTIAGTAAYVQEREADVLGAIGSAAASAFAHEAATAGVIIATGRRAADAVKRAAANTVAEVVAPPLSVVITGKRAVDALAAKAVSGIASSAAREVKEVTDVVRHTAAAANAVASGTAAALGAHAAAARDDLANSAAVTGRLFGVDAKLGAVAALAGAAAQDITRRSNMAERAAAAALSQGGASSLSAAKGVDYRRGDFELLQFIPFPMRGMVQRAMEGTNGRGLPGAMGRLIANKVFQAGDADFFGSP